jgi:hypothetical protein
MSWDFMIKRGRGVEGIKRRLVWRWWGNKRNYMEK